MNTPRISTVISEEENERLEEVRRTGISLRTVVRVGIDTLYDRLCRAGVIRGAYWLLIGVVINYLSMEKRERTVRVRATSRADAFLQAASMLYDDHEVWFDVPLIKPEEDAPAT